MDVLAHNRMEIMDKEDEDWTEINSPVPDWTCASFTPGRRFEDMTYAEMFNDVQRLHVSNGGVHLAVHSRPSKDAQEKRSRKKIRRNVRVFTIACASGMTLMDAVVCTLQQEHPNQHGHEALLINQEVCDICFECK